MIDVITDSRARLSRVPELSMHIVHIVRTLVDCYLLCDVSMPDRRGPPARNDSVLRGYRLISISSHSVISPPLIMGKDTARSRLCAITTLARVLISPLKRPPVVIFGPLSFEAHFNFAVQLFSFLSPLSAAGVHGESFAFLVNDTRVSIVGN